MIKYISRLTRATNVNKIMTMDAFKKSSNEFIKNSQRKVLTKLS